MIALLISDLLYYDYNEQRYLHIEIGCILSIFILFTYKIPFNSNAKLFIVFLGIFFKKFMI